MIEVREREEGRGEIKGSGEEGRDVGKGKERYFSGIEMEAGEVRFEGGKGGLGSFLLWHCMRVCSSSWGFGTAERWSGKGKVSPNKLNTPGPGSYCV